MAGGFVFVRRGVGAVGVVAAVLVGAAPAGADPVSGMVLDEGTPGLNVNVGPEWLADLPTELLDLRLSDGTTLDVYCIEIRTTIDHDQPLVEKDWADYPAADSPFVANQARINWILHNGFPVVGTEQLASRLGALDDGLSTEEAIAGTQAAIWHLSDGVDLNREDPVPGEEAAGADVLALYDFLTGPANVGIGAQPAASLEFEPDTLAGEAGERIGPFTVRTNGSVEKVTPELPAGVTLVDENGATPAADAVEDGTKLFLDVPAGTADGAASVELTATARVETGRMFVGRDYGEGDPTQTMIVADSQDSQVTATARGEWPAKQAGEPAPGPAGEVGDDTVENAVATGETPAPQAKADTGSDLAETGASLLTPGLVGLALVGLGTIVLRVRGRRTHL